MNKLRRISLIMLCIASTGVAWAAEPDAQLNLIGRILAHDATLVLLDVRTAEEYSAGHIEAARNIPHDKIALGVLGLPADKNAEIVVYCRSGRRSALALERLQQLGYKHVEHLQGDFIGWQAAKRPVEAPAPAVAPVAAPTAAAH